MNLYYVYILLCSDNSFYTGITNNVERRLVEHNTGLNSTSYTFSRRPVNLVFYENFQNPNQAIAFEKRVKGWTRKKKQALIEKNWDKLKVLSICTNGTNYKNYENTSATLSVTRNKG